MPALKNRKPILRFFEGIPVRDGRGDILVQPNAADIKGATRRDPQNCAYARCLKRILGTGRVFVYTSVAYVETLDQHGSPLMERYMIRNHAHAYIKAFDKGLPVAPGGFVLNKPSPGQTLEHKRAQSQDYARRNPDRVRRYYKASYAKAKNPHPRLLEGSFRDGKGQVHFVGSEGILATPSPTLALEEVIP